MTAVYERRMLVLREVEQVLRFPHLHEVGAYHVLHFRAPDGFVSSPRATVERDLRWLADEGYLRRTEPGRYILTVAGKARCEQLAATS